MFNLVFSQISCCELRNLLGILGHSGNLDGTRPVSVPEALRVDQLC